MPIVRTAEYRTFLCGGSQPPSVMGASGNRRPSGGARLCQLAITIHHYPRQRARLLQPMRASRINRMAAELRLSALLDVGWCPLDRNDEGRRGMRGPDRPSLRVTAELLCVFMTGVRLPGYGDKLEPPRDHRYFLVSR